MTFLEVRANGRASTFPLGATPVVIGRQRDSDLVLELEAVSRRHAEIRPASGAYVIEDLGSRNGTFVNGQRIAGITPLRAGDVIGICEAELAVRTPAPSDPGNAGASGDLQVTLIDAGLDPGAVVSTMSASSQSGQSGSLRPEDALRAVREVTGLLTGKLALEELLARVLDAVFALFPQADQGVVMLQDNAGELVPVAAKERGRGSGELRVSRTVLRQALDRKEAILSTNAATDAQFASSQSLLSMPIHSLMCVPLLSQDDAPLGVIELHAESEKARFTREGLDLLLSVASTAAIAVENTRLHDQLLAQDRLERDLQHARAVQQSFLPSGVPEVAGYRFFAHYESAETVGGDYYAFVELPDDRVAIGIADVSGKGMPAALMMARLSSDVRFALTQTRDPSEALQHVNRSLAESGLEDRFVTMLLMVLDARAHTLDLASAGHPPPLLRTADGATAPVSVAKIGVPLNVSDAPRLQPETTSIGLAVGDVLLAYTDGISEAMDGNGDLFGDDRVRELVAASSSGAVETAQELLEAVAQFSKGLPLGDDTTVVSFGRTA